MWDPPWFSDYQFFKVAGTTLVLWLNFCSQPQNGADLTDGLIGKIWDRANAPRHWSFALLDGRKGSGKVP